VKVAAALLLLLYPVSALAESASKPEFSFVSSFLQMIAALSIVIGLILLAKYFSARLMSGAPGAMSSRHIRIIETRHLSPKKSLMLVEVGGEYLLLASSEEGINLLKKVDIIEEIEVVEEKGGLSSGLAGLWQKRGRL
jgi:flagellar protein FliO/FliZ